MRRQQQRQLPVRYFLVTFTLPAALRALAWAHQRQLYDAMIGCSWQTIAQFARHDRQLRGDTGSIAVLHTHSRRLDYHPHVHLVVPAGAVDTKARQWRVKRSTRKRPYLFSHKALAKVFRAKLLQTLTNAGLALPPCYPATWVVDCKAVGSGEKALVYLSRYLYRGVILEKHIACRDGKVTFRYRCSKTGEYQYRTEPGARFLALVLRHVLPRGFRRARNFGLLHPNRKRLIALLQVLLPAKAAEPPTPPQSRPPITCPCCGAAMRIIRTGVLPFYASESPPPLTDPARALEAAM